MDETTAVVEDAEVVVTASVVAIEEAALVALVVQSEGLYEGTALQGEEADVVLPPYGVAVCCKIRPVGVMYPPVYTQVAALRVTTLLLVADEL